MPGVWISIHLLLDINKLIKEVFIVLESILQNTLTISLFLKIFGESSSTTAEGSSSHGATLRGHNGACWEPGSSQTLWLRGKLSDSSIRYGGTRK